jgi:DNA-binding CsgD family transcriptional regulator
MTHMIADIPPISLISDREREVIRLLALGYNSHQIAKRMYISAHTVNTHRRNLIAKLDARNTVHMVVKAMRMVGSNT